MTAAGSPPVDEPMVIRLLPAVLDGPPPVRHSERLLIVEVPDDISLVALPAALRHCDGAATVVASPRIEALLRGGGHRGPIVNDLADVDPAASVVAGDRAPVIADNCLSTGADHR